MRCQRLKWMPTPAYETSSRKNWPYGDGPLQLEHQRHQPDRMSRRRVSGNLEPEAAAVRGCPVVLLGRLHVEAAHQLQWPPSTAPKLGAEVGDLRLDGEWLPPEDPFSTTVHAQRSELLRDQYVDRFKREVLSLNGGAQEIFITQMRALVIQTHTCAETVAAIRQRNADDVIRIDQVVRLRIEIELRERCCRPRPVERPRLRADLPNGPDRSCRRCPPMRAWCPCPTDPPATGTCRAGSSRTSAAPSDPR